jgi:hypothetical protein
MNKIWKITIFIGLILWGASSCSTTSKIPKPVLDATIPTPPPQTSFVHIPIVLNIASLMTMVEKQVPKEFLSSSDWTCEGNNCVKFEAHRDKLEAYMKENVLVAGARVRYWIEYCRKTPLLGCPKLASCGVGEEQPTLHVGIKSLITWNANWGLNTKTEAIPVTYGRECKVSVVNYNISPKIRDAFQPKLEAQVADLDKQLAQYTNFRNKADSVWLSFQRPMALGENTWLELKPQSIFVSSIKGNLNTISTSIGLIAQPKVSIMENVAMPAPSAPKPLPPLKVINNPNEHPQGFNIELETEISYPEASKMANQNMIGQTFESGNKKVKIKTIELYGAGEKVVVVVDLEGSFNGRFYGVGKPVYNPDKQSIDIQDFDFSIETKNILHNSANWILHSTIKNKMLDYLSYPIGDRLEKAKLQLQQQLQKPLTSNFRLESKIEKLEPIGVYNTGNSLKAIILAKGQLKGILK